MTKEEFLTELTATRPVLMRYALYLTADNEKANDLLQGTITRAYCNYKSFVPGTNFTQWMITIMRNLYLNNTEREKNAAGYKEYLATYREVENNTPEQQLLVHDLQTVINAMHPELRDVIKLRIKGMSYDEIAKTLNIPLPTVKNRLFDARTEIKRELKK